MSSIHKKLQQVHLASTTLLYMKEEDIQVILRDVAQKLRTSQKKICKENQKDLLRMEQNNPLYDRLLLTQERVEQIADSVDTIANMESPVGHLIEEKNLRNGLLLQKKTVPFGVIGVIYEARPNVTIDVFALCFHSCNACVLKGSSDAYHTNLFLVQLMQEVLKNHDVDTDVLFLLPIDREVVKEMLEAKEYIDIIIPRGSAGLISFARDNAKIPVIETGAGIVHMYFDVSGDIEKGSALVLNAKTRRPSVCNSLGTLLVHRDRLEELMTLVEPLAEKNVRIFADDTSYEILVQIYPQLLLSKATEEHFGREFLSLQMVVKVVGSIDEAMVHIARYSSKHSEVIVAEDKEVQERFLTSVDAACVYVNASSAFTDGGEFGLGAEIGISTQKLHARGPMGLRELTTYKWLIRGDGQVRS